MNKKIRYGFVGKKGLFFYDFRELITNVTGGSREKIINAWIRPSRSILSVKQHGTSHNKILAYLHHDKTAKNE